jgi:hypothetical protein
MEAREGTSRRERAVASARIRLRAGWVRVRSGWLQILQTALAAYLQTSGDPDETRRLALGAARVATTMLEEHEDLARNLGVNALVDQIYSSAVDLAGGTGLDRAATLQALQES